MRSGNRAQALGKGGLLVSRERVPIGEPSTTPRACLMGEPRLESHDGVIRRFSRAKVSFYRGRTCCGVLRCLVSSAVDLMSRCEGATFNRTQATANKEGPGCQGPSHIDQPELSLLPVGDGCKRAAISTPAHHQEIHPAVKFKVREGRAQSLRDKAYRPNSRTVSLSTKVSPSGDLIACLGLTTQAKKTHLSPPTPTRSPPWTPRSAPCSRASTP